MPLKTSLRPWLWGLALPAFHIQHAAGFCEANYGGMFNYHGGKRGSYYPEYGNSISALAMAVFGTHMLIFWDSQSAIFVLLASLFVVNAWGSFMFHYTGAGSWGALDADSMILAALMMWGFVFQQFIKCYVHRQNNDVLRVDHFRHRMWLALSWSSALSFAFWVMSGAVVPSTGESLYGDIFEISFGLPIVVSVILLLIVIFHGWIDNQYITERQRKRAIHRCFFGFGVSTFGFISWVANEKYCDTSAFFHVFPGHILWHFFMPYGILNMLVLIVFLQAARIEKRPQFFEEWYPSGQRIGQFAQWYFKLVPAFHFHDLEDLIQIEVSKKHTSSTCYSDRERDGDDGRCPADVVGLERAVSMVDDRMQLVVEDLDQEAEQIRQGFFDKDGAAKPYEAEDVPELPELHTLQKTAD
jgi:hypothetical protein